MMIARTSLPDFGPATMCVVSKVHNPPPLRHVWHHIQPQEAGGQTVAANLVQLCDGCHMSIHRLMWQLARGLPLDFPPRRKTLAYATAGYEACVAAGTVMKIPNEG